MYKFVLKSSNPRCSVISTVENLKLNGLGCNDHGLNDTLLCLLPPGVTMSTTAMIVMIKA